MSRRIARVVLDSPLPQLDRLFDYAIPKEMDGVLPGVRVKVPLRSAGRMIQAYVVELADETDEQRALSEIDSLVSCVEVLPERLYQLVRKVADRAAGSASDILRLVIPKRQVRVEKTWAAPEQVTCVPSAAADAEITRYLHLETTLAQGGRAVVETIPGVRDGILSWARLFAALALRTLARGESCILVVPDHRDLDHLTQALGDSIPTQALVTLDSRMSNPDRYRAFMRTLASAPCVVVGNRSAVYAPVQATVVALWDDGDNLLAEQLAPYVHARDAALVRQELEGSSLLLASYSRSTDAERLVERGWMQEITAERRITPRVRLSTPQELEQLGRRVHSSAFTAARQATEHGPVLVQVSRPGYSPSLVCGTCRAPSRCAHCGGPLGAKSRGAIPVCAWCARHARAWHCPHCEGATVRLAASGTERTADELGRAFPGIRVIVADSTHPVATVPDRPALVVATRGAEPVAVNGYHAVVLLDGARMLQAPDLRVAESCLRWWSNAAALAAADAPIHLVGVDGAVARAFATWSQGSYARTELAERAPLRLPPTVRVALVQGERAAVGSAAEALSREGLPAEAFLGPVPLDDDTGRVRMLVRFEYAHGTRVAASLRASVIAAAVARRPGRPTKPALTVRLDILDPEL